MNRHLKFVLITITLSFMSCNSAPKTNNEFNLISSAQVEDSSLDSSFKITYLLGHDRYRIEAWTTAGVTGGRKFFDQDIVKESPIDQKSYLSILKQVNAFIDATERRPAAQNYCRLPYEVEIRVGKTTRVAKGCRQSDELSKISHLSRDAELLLYSKK